MSHSWRATLTHGGIAAFEVCCEVDRRCMFDVIDDSARIESKPPEAGRLATPIGYGSTQACAGAPAVTMRQGAIRSGSLVRSMGVDAIAVVVGEA